MVSRGKARTGGRQILFATGPKDAVAKTLGGGTLRKGSEFLVTQWKTPDGKSRQWMFTDKDFKRKD